MGCNADNKHLELGSIDPQLKEVFTTAGVSDNQLKNPRMRDFIYDFIDNHGGIQAFVKENALLNVKKSEVQDSKPQNTLEPPPPVPPRTTSAVMSPSNNVNIDATFHSISLTFFSNCYLSIEVFNF